MASPWITPQRVAPQRPPAERPWMGMAMLVAVPLLSLILIRMLWSGSSLWFLTLGIILLGSAAVVFLARRPQDAYGRTLAQEPSRVPLVLAGLGVLFLAMLLLPNFAGSGSDDADLATRQPQQQQQQQPPAQQPPAQSSSSSTGLQSEVSGVSQPLAQQPPAQAPESQAPSQEAAPATGSQTYVVADGDTLWDIADRFGTTVAAIVAANSLSNAADLQIGQELTIPPEGDDSGATEESAPVEDGVPVSGQ